ncbi:MAG: MgtC/SapB family protein [Candidatus Auribacterota bacterium]|nr:MgtC/SapB family protein [Candidatus Auribacterota bacterium]
MENMASYFNEILFASELTYRVICLRLIFAVLAGAVIGAERERHTKPAGLRTHMIICVGAALLMLLSIYLPSKTGGDPGRIAAQVVTGIGFLGAGAIFRLGFNVRGLTSAASIWTTAAIGLTIGAGMYAASIFAVAILLLTLNVVTIIESKIFTGKIVKALTIITDNHSGVVEKTIKVLENNNVSTGDLSIVENIEKGTTELRTIVHIIKEQGTKRLFKELRTIEGIKKISLD